MVKTLNAGKRYKENVTYRVEGNLRILDIHDYARLVIDYQKRRLTLAPKFWFGGEMPVEERSYGVLCYNPENPLYLTSARLGQIVREEGTEILEKIINLEMELRGKVESELNQASYALETNSLSRDQIVRVFETVAHYGSLRIDTTFPNKTAKAMFAPSYLKLSEKEKEEKIFQDLGMLFLPSNGKFYLYDVYLGLVQLAQDLADGRQPPMSYFIKTLGYLTKNDLSLGYLEDPERILEEISKMVHVEPYIDFREKRNLLHRTRMTSLAEKEEIRKRILQGRGKDKKSLNTIISYAGVVGIFDDQNRRFRTGIYYLFAKILGKLGLNLSTTGLAEIT